MRNNMSVIFTLESEFMIGYQVQVVFSSAPEHDDNSREELNPKDNKLYIVLIIKKK